MGCIDCEKSNGKLTEVTFDSGHILEDIICERCIIHYVEDSDVDEIDRVRLTGNG